MFCLVTLVWAVSALQLGMASTVLFHRGGGSLCPIYEIFQRGSFGEGGKMGERKRQILSKPFENDETKSMGEGGRKERKGERERKTEGIKIYLP